MVLMTCAPAEAAASFSLDWWHMLSSRAVSGARQPPVSKRHPCNPSAAATQWQTDPKQTESFFLSSLYFNLFLSQPPTPLHSPLCLFSVSPCYFSLPYVVHPSSAFSPNVPTEPDLMDDPLLWRLGSPRGPLPSSTGIWVRQSDRASSGRRLTLSMCTEDIRGICIEGWQNVSAEWSLMVSNGQSRAPVCVLCPPTPTPKAICPPDVAEGLR